MAPTKRVAPSLRSGRDADTNPLSCAVALSTIGFGPRRGETLVALSNVVVSIVLGIGALLVVLEAVPAPAVNETLARSLSSETGRNTIPASSLWRP